MSAGLSPWSKGWCCAESGRDLPDGRSLEFNLGFNAYHDSVLRELQLRGVSSIADWSSSASPVRSVESPSDKYLRAKGLL